MDSDTQVLVVGAGPVGLFMAAELCRHGVSCRVIDKASEPKESARASVIQSRTLEIFDSLGILGQFREAGVECRDVVVTKPDLEPLHAISYDALDSHCRFSLSIEQRKTEQLLTAHLEALGGRVERQVALTGFEQDGTGVTAVLGRAGGSQETVRSAYVVGCDGAHSLIRHLLGVAFEGKSMSQVFAVAEGRVDWQVPLPSNQIRFFVSEEGQLFYGPFRAGRCIFAGNCDASRDIPAADAEPSLEELEALLSSRTPGATLSDVTWKAYFHVNLRQADRYSVGRVFLAGDAAHVQSPAGGQGMNTGIQDAYNLGWKLGLVMAGGVPASLLESYHPERHRAGKDMLILNEYLYHVEMERQVDLPPPEDLKRHLAAVLASQEVIQQRMRRAVAELNINYRHSPIVAQHQLLPAAGGEAVDHEAYHVFVAAPHAGDRPADARLVDHPSGESVGFCQVRRGTRHHLFLLAGLRSGEEACLKLRSLRDEIAGSYGRRLAAHLVVPKEVPDSLRADPALLVDPKGELHQRFGAELDCLYLIRPDGYVGFRSQPVDAEALKSYLKRIFEADQKEDNTTTRPPDHAT